MHPCHPDGEWASITRVVDRTTATATARSGITPVLTTSGAISDPGVDTVVDVWSCRRDHRRAPRQVWGVRVACPHPCCCTVPAAVPLPGPLWRASRGEYGLRPGNSPKTRLTASLLDPCVSSTVSPAPTSTTPRALAVGGFPVGVFLASKKIGHRLHSPLSGVLAQAVRKSC